MTRVAPIDSAPEYSKPPGPIQNRSCRDVFFLLLFAVYWAGMVILAILAITNGDTRRLVLSSDSYGNVCGLKATDTVPQQQDMSSTPYLFFLNPTNPDALQLCVSACPTQTVVPTYSNQNYKCAYGLTNVTSQSTLVDNMKLGLCSFMLYETKSVFNRCMPSGNLTAALLLNAANAAPSKTTDILKGTAEVLSWSKDVARNLFQDLATSWQYMLAALAACLVLCFVWMFILRFMAGFFTIITIVSIEGILGYLAYFTYGNWLEYKAAYETAVSNGVASPQITNERDIALALFVVCAAFAALFLVMIIALRNRIRVAINIVKEASRAIACMPLIVFFPIFPFIAIAILTAYYLVIAAYISTTPDTANLSLLGVNQTITYIKYFQWYHLFGYLWTLAFLVGINQTTLAGSIATWYWSRDKKHLPGFPVLRSFYRTIRYSLGSIAIGSLLIAITQIIRIALIYAQKQAQQSKNKAAVAILSCLQCCFTCIEAIVKFLNKNAYIMIAVNGTSFCTAGRTAAELLLRNAFRLLAVNFVAGFLLLLSKAVVALASAGGLYVALTYLNRAGTTQVQTIGPVCILVFVAAWTIVSCFFGVYRMAVDTIFLSFCEDCERNDGTSQKPYFMSSGLAALLNVKVTEPPMQEITVRK